MDPRQIKTMKWVLLVSSAASLLLLVSAAYRENFGGEWRQWQQQYQLRLTQTAGTDRARQAAGSFRVEHRQLYLPELGVIDRCTTCHCGVENPAMADEEQPLRRHGGDVLKHHPADTFGCTICHQGQGRATTKAEAHGWKDNGEAIAYVESPLLRGEAVYTSCGRCHAEVDLYGGVGDLFASSENGDAPGKKAPPITDTSLALSLPAGKALREGKRLTVALGCLGCHKYRGRGGVLGPDLTHVGDKTKHDFDFSHVAGEHTVERWLYEHFMFPSEVSPETVMPDMGLSPEQGRSLALYMMSLHRKTAPASHTPPPKIEGPGNARTVRGETLYSMFCSACHGANGFGTTARVGLWPTDADPWGHNWDARDIVVEQRSDIDVMVPSLNHADTLSVLSDDYLRYIIARGRPGTKMIGWSHEGGLSEDEITLLVDYIRRWEPPVPDIASVSSARGDPRVGGALYRANCAACHGPNGEGGIGVSLNAYTFLAAASDAYLRDTIIHGRPNTAMPAWREFDAREISDLLAYIRQWQMQRSDVETSVALCSGPETDDVSASIGRILYRTNCVMCHGRKGSGDLGPSLNTQAFLTTVSDRYLVETMIEGRPGTGMPGWRHLSDDDIASIVRYIRKWQKEPSKPAQWHAQAVPRGDWDAGRLLFGGACAGCHGTDGEGAIGPQLNNPVFLRTTSDVMLREWIANGKEGTPMLGFRKGGQGIGELSERQIEDIVAFLRSLERKSEGQIARVSKSPNGRPEKGALVYAKYCVECHGRRGEGGSGPALSNPNFLRFASDGFLMATMAMGRSGTEMRPIKRGPQSIIGLSSDQVNDLVAYLRWWEHNPPFGAGQEEQIPHRFVVPWDLSKGRELFASFCAGCHGEEGKGLWAPELNNEGFLAAATDGTIQATIVRGRTGTAMRSFGVGGHGLADLRSEDIDNIVAYMRQWSKLTPSPMTIPAEHSQQAARSRTARKVTAQVPQTTGETPISSEQTTGADRKSTHAALAAMVPHRKETQ